MDLGPEPSLPAHLRATMDQRRERTRTEYADLGTCSHAVHPCDWHAGIVDGVTAYMEDLGALLTEIMVSSPDLCAGGVTVVAMVLDHAGHWSDLLEPITPE